MKCIECATETKESLKKYIANLDNCVIIIKDVPAHVCPHCGEVYYNNDVAEKIEQIILQLENLIQEVAIIEYNKIA